MAAKLFTMSKNDQSASYSSAAVACTSARIMMTLGTALLAVSIIIIRIISFINILAFFP